MPVFGLKKRNPGCNCCEQPYDDCTRCDLEHHTPRHLKVTLVGVATLFFTYARINLEINPPCLWDLDAPDGCVAGASLENIEMTVGLVNAPGYSLALGSTTPGFGAQYEGLIPPALDGIIPDCTANTTLDLVSITPGCPCPFPLTALVETV